MLLKTLIKKVSNIIYKILLLHVFLKTKDKDMQINKTNLMLVVVAFNNLDILEVQYRYLKNFLTEQFDYVIADNSNKIESSKNIKEFCKENKISYVKVPWNPLTNVRASGSHAIALNWITKNIIRKYKPTFWGFLDHDIFPIKRTSVLENLDKGLWGAIRTRKEKWWYLWPGFCFFEYEKVRKYNFNFFPYHADKDGLTFLDTGGSNYLTVYQKLGRENLREAKSKIINLNTNMELKKGEDSSQTFELINSHWLHLRQIAWRKESFNKMSELENIIKKSQDY